MGEAKLHEAVRFGAPLVEIMVSFVEGIDYDAATARLNALAEDFHLHPKPWYDRPSLRVGSATKQALERLFGWHLKRVPLPRYDEQTKSWGNWSNTFMWAEVSPVVRHPVEGLISSIGMSQPGADDDGQWCE